MSHIVVLGATGDLGSVVVDVCHRRDWRVTAPPRAELDLRVEADVRSFFTDLPAGYIVFFAAFVDRRRAETQRELADNRMIVENVARFARADWLMFCSSIAVYGDQPSIPITEESPVVSAGNYALAKVGAEISLSTSLADRTPVLNVRLPGVFGGRGPRNQSLDRILAGGIRDGVIDLGANGRVLRDWISATEVAEFALTAAETRPSGLINLARGESSPIDDYVALAMPALPGVTHLPADRSLQAAHPPFVFNVRHLSEVVPSWTFPPRARDILAMAKELWIAERSHG